MDLTIIIITFIILTPLSRLQPRKWFNSLFLNTVCYNLPTRYEQHLIIYFIVYNFFFTRVNL